MITNNTVNPDISPFTKVLAIVITFNPDLGFIHRCKLHLAQFDSLLIVDNASQAEGRDFVEQTVSLYPKTTVIWNQINLGIAAALNQGVAFARQSGFEWVCTFDQDSTITQDYLSDMMKVALAAECVGRVALVSPYYVDETTRNISRFASKYQQTSNGVELGLVVVTITSGDLIPTRTFDIVGLFDESLFIDLVDYDFCFRCLDNKLLVVEAKNVSLIHNGGSVSLHKTIVRSRPFVTSNHSAFRTYFIARNRMIIYRKYICKHPIWCLRDIKLFCKELITTALFEDNKYNKLINTARGLIHGLIGITGPAPLNLAK